MHDSDSVESMLDSDSVWGVESIVMVGSDSVWGVGSIVVVDSDSVWGVESIVVVDFDSDSGSVMGDESMVDFEVELMVDSEVEFDLHHHP